MEEVVIKRKLGIIPKFFLSILFIIILLYIWMHFIETKLIVVKDTMIDNPKTPANYEGFTIVHFSDIHFGRTTNENELKKVVKKINECKADIVLFSGDLFDPYINLRDNNIEFLKNTLKEIKSNLKKYAVLGDNDYLNEETYKSIMESAGFKILDDNNEAIYYSNIPIYISGTSSITKNTPDYTKAFQKEIDSLQLFLTHEPSVINIIGDKADLVFAGHSLGGLIRLPILGGLIKKDNTANYEYGSYQINETTLYINNGVGTENYSLRFFNIPTIDCYRLK